MRPGKKFDGRWQTTSTSLKCTLIAQLSSKELPEQKLSGIALVYCSCFDSLWNDTKPFTYLESSRFYIVDDSCFVSCNAHLFQKGLNKMHFYWRLDETPYMWKHLEWAHMNISLYTQKLLFADFSLSPAPKIQAHVIGFFILMVVEAIRYLHLAQSLESRWKTQCFVIV